MVDSGKTSSDTEVDSGKTSLERPLKFYFDVKKSAAKEIALVVKPGIQEIKRLKIEDVDFRGNLNQKDTEQIERL